MKSSKCDAWCSRGISHHSSTRSDFLSDHNFRKPRFIPSDHTSKDFICLFEAVSIFFSHPPPFLSRFTRFSLPRLRSRSYQVEESQLVLSCDRRFIICDGMTTGREFPSRLIFGIFPPFDLASRSKTLLRSHARPTGKRRTTPWQDALPVA